MSNNEAATLDPQTPSQDALSAVAQVGNRAEELIRVWRDAGNAAAIVEVAEGGSGAARKAARRAIGVLKSRGISIPERRHVAQLTTATEESTEAWMIPPDASLNMVFVLARWPKARRGKVVFAYLNDGFGLVRVRIAEIAQSGLKAEVKRMTGDRVRLVKVPLEWARARIAAARAKNAEHDIPLPLGLTSASDLLEPAPASPPPHPFDEEGLALADEDALTMAKDSGLLHRMPEFAAWLPSREAVQEMLRELGKELTPGVQPSEEELNERMQAAIRSATDRYFSPQLRERLVTAMKDSALSVLAREGEVKTLEVVAALQAIEKRGLITDPPHEVPFLRAFFEKAVQLLASQNNGQLRIPVAGTGTASAPSDAPDSAEAPAGEASASDSPA